MTCANPGTGGNGEENQLAALVSSRVRAALLCWLVPRLESRFTLTDLSRETGLAISSLQHECYKLERLGVLRGVREGQSRFYSAQLELPVSRALVNLVLSILGMEKVLEVSVGELGDFEIVTLALSASPPRKAVTILIGTADLDSLARIHQRVALILDLDPASLETAYFERVVWDEDDEPKQRLLARLAGHALHVIVGEWPPRGSH
ncbi:MAG TPA: hypothetical protein VD767_04195 [Thermomicrobiales bacterium]|nr:hypothetical protein [Thermomicrobiales bacterium]